jgi:hypothetical protein
MARVGLHASGSDSVRAVVQATGLGAAHDGAPHWLARASRWRRCKLFAVSPASAVSSGSHLRRLSPAGDTRAWRASCRGGSVASEARGVGRA